MAKVPLEIDWTEMLPGRDDGPPPEVDVVASAPSGGSEIAHLSDHELQDRIQRVAKHLCSEIGDRLVDNGAKLKASLGQMQKELDSRKRALEAKDDAGCNRVSRLKNSESSGTFRDDSEIGNHTAPESLSQPSFTFKFVDKLQEKADVAFDEELKIISHSNNRSSGKNALQKHETGQKIAISSQQARLSSRQTPFQSVSSCAKKDRQTLSVHSEDLCSSSLPEEKIYSNHKRMRASDTLGRSSMALKLNKVNDVVVLDEQETHPTQPAEDDSDKWKAVKVYYPSRDDPESVELSFTDIKCLEPESYLSSTIMNFYIRYLQDRPRGDYYFFNTYFYKKLQEAVSPKANKASFVKLRRWWKGVSLFQKSYIFIPVHRDMHWSLVIICIPAKEDESGPIVLHLDSLGIHDSYLILDVMDRTLNHAFPIILVQLGALQRYLKAEWNYIIQNSPPPELPFTEKIWRNLSRRIKKKKITVPQQKNEYDCGLFVLYFMERFIEEAPERLKGTDLTRFDSSKWFQPEDASGLRKRIRDLLLEIFQHAKHKNSTAESACSRDSSEDD